MCIITTDQLDFSQSNLEDNFIQIQPLDNTKTDEIEPIEADKKTSNEIEPIEADNETPNGTNISNGEDTSDGSEAVNNNINEGNLKEAVCEEEANSSNFKNSTRRTSGRQKKEVCESN
jgi:hypothetical protein